MSTKKKDPLVHLTAGGISGLASCVLLQPFDLVKTRLQQQQQQLLLKNNDGKSKSLNSTILRTVKNIIENESISGLWKGTVPTILRNVPGSALYFFTLSEIRQLLSKHQKVKSQNFSNSSLPVLSNRDNLIAGMVARGSIGLIMMPITVIKVRYESNLYNYKSIWSAFTSILKHEGIKGLFYGYGATAIRDSPYAGLYLLFYERWKLLITNSTAIASPIIHMTSAAIAGFSATTITHPFDMLKTRMQLKPQTYPNIWLGSLKILKEEGFIGFFNGLTLRLGRKTTQAVINWTIYEALVTWFQQRRNH
ncbi:mitochondrial carrier domain-containing protein [Glomus cerebriforme]|uniref:Mitochondrial glycine transporter n=1 Tax=Glomus cerebriforme TaxID=658196 RepID=A0A397TB80_9GLOM|nr:mitochondrial carrier domain-containing protein [Glomus cerebriforme]